MNYILKWVVFSNEKKSGCFDIGDLKRSIWNKQKYAQKFIFLRNFTRRFDERRYHFQERNKTDLKDKLIEHIWKKWKNYIRKKYS